MRPQPGVIGFAETSRPALPVADLRQPIRVRRSRHGASARSTIPAAAFLLSIVAALAFLRAAALIPPPSGDVLAAEDGEQLARRFYAALNDAIRTGDPSYLDGLVAPALLSATGPPERGALPGRIRAAHLSAPNQRLILDDVLVERGRVVARISTQGGRPSAFSGSPLGPPDIVWGPVDLLRVVDGQIAEYQPAVPAPILEPLALVPGAVLPAAPRRAGLARLSFAPGGYVPAQEARGPITLVVEDGEVLVHLDRPASLVRAAPLAPQGTIRVMGEVTLRRGDCLAIDAAVTFALRNPRPAPATILGSAVLPDVGTRRTDKWAPPQPPLDVLLFLPPTPGEVVSPAGGGPAPAGVHSELLVGSNTSTLPDGPVTIALARVTLPPHAALPSGPATGTRLVNLATGSGRVRTLAGEPLVRPGAQRPLSRLSLAEGTAAAETAIGAGANVLLPAGSIATIHSEGTGVLEALVLTLHPTSTLSVATD